MRLTDTRQQEQTDEIDRCGFCGVTDHISDDVPLAHSRPAGSLATAGSSVEHAREPVERATEAERIHSRVRAGKRVCPT